MIDRLLTVAALAAVALCEQPHAPAAPKGFLRELPWAQLNFLHTTDIHGWWSGHLQEPSYSADWGDYISFIHHLRERADADGTDVIVVDTGDRVEGNGLYDGSSPRGKYTFDIFKGTHIDLLSSGNHELYKRSTSEEEFNHTIPAFADQYIASNLDIYHPETGKLVPMAQRFKKFTTKNQGIRILAFGFLFDFDRNANNTVVQPVEETVKEGWFQDAIRDKDIDLILVFGHVAIRSKEYDTIFDMIRAVQWDTPIAFLGGHFHIRDFKTYDKKSAALASGRYMETIGFMSVDGLSTSKAKPQGRGLKFDRRYIDNNLYSLSHHSKKEEAAFKTEQGKNVSQLIAKARSELKLDHRFGCAPTDLWLNRVPYPNKFSILSWLETRVLPDQMGKDSSIKKGDRKAIAMTNTGAIRFDIFAGPFTKDITYILSPFTSGFKVLQDIPYSAAKQVINLLNHGGPVLQTVDESSQRSMMRLAPPEQWGNRPDFVAPSSTGASSESLRGHQVPFKPIEDKSITPGYTTDDDGGKEGDDTVHSPISFYNVPNCIQAPIGFDAAQAEKDSEEPKEVDIIYNEFIEPYLLLALAYLGQNVTKTDAKPFGDGITLTKLITDWVEGNWKCD